MNKWIVGAAGMLVAIGLVAAGCGKGDGGAQPAATAQATGAATATADAGKIWSERCVRCHGKKGEGNGPDSASLDPKPRSFLDAAWQAETTDDHINKVILGGGTAVGKSALMPPNPDLEGKPEVVAAIKDIVRGFAKK